MFVFLLVVDCVLSSGIIKETMNEWSPLRVLPLEFCNGGSSQKCDDMSIRLDRARALDRQTDRRSVCIACWQPRKKSSTAITWLISENLISSPVLLRLQQQNVWHNFIVRITDFSRKFRLMHGSMFEVRYTVKHFKTNVPISCNNHVPVSRRLRRAEASSNGLGWVRTMKPVQDSNTNINSDDVTPPHHYS